jgi:hypothetical protein
MNDNYQKNFLMFNYKLNLMNFDKEEKNLLINLF